MFFSLLYQKKKVYWFEEQNQTRKKIAWSRTKQEFSRENGRGKMRGWPERDRLWGSSWWRRGLFRWPRLWRDDRHRAMRGTGGKHRTNPMAAISVRSGLGFWLGLVRGEVWLLSMPSLYLSRCSELTHLDQNTEPE